MEQQIKVLEVESGLEIWSMNLASMLLCLSPDFQNLLHLFSWVTTVLVCGFQIR